jgi:ABC-type lipoprotein release transport system permease subunit
VTLDERTLTLVVLVLAAILVVLIVWVALLQRSEARLRRRLRRVLPDGQATSLDQALEQQLQRVDALSGRVDALNKLHHELEAITQRTLQKVGVIRYNPFADAGGDQSFAIALLDAEGNGVVVSSLHSRTETRVFAKPVQAGRSRYPLSDEEQEAVRKALAPSS